MADLSTTDSLIEKQRAEVDAEIEKLRPAAEEYERLVAYRDSMGAASPRKRATRAPRGGNTSTPARSDANRPQQFLDAVKDNPGATIPQIAAAIGDVSANYLYRVRDTLVEEKKVRKEGQQHFLENGEAASEGGGKRGSRAAA